MIGAIDENCTMEPYIKEQVYKTKLYDYKYAPLPFCVLCCASNILATSQPHKTYIPLIAVLGVVHHRD